MLSISSTFLSKGLQILRTSFLLVTLSTLGFQSFLVTKREHIPINYFNKDGNYKSILSYNKNNFNCSSRIFTSNNTHSINDCVNETYFNCFDSEDTKSKNLLALLCNKSKKIEILKTLIDSVLKKTSNLGKILYVTSSDQNLFDIFDSPSYNSPKSRINMISQGMTRVYDESFLTLSTIETLFGYYNLFNNGVEFDSPKFVKLNGRAVVERNSGRFQIILKSIIDSFFMSNEDLMETKYNKNPKTLLKSEFYIPSNKFIDNNFMDSEELIRFMNKVLSRGNLVFIDDFDYEYDSNSNKCKYNFKDHLVGVIKKNCTFIGTSEGIYISQFVRDWLGTLLGPVRVVTLSKSPKFKLLTSYGPFDIFSTVPQTYARKFTNLEPERTKEIYNYMKKKSNLVKLTNINSEINEVLSRSIYDSLSSIGLNNINRVLRVSKKVNDLLKNYFYKVRNDKDFINSENKLLYLLRSIVDVSKNKILSSLIKEMRLEPLIKKIQTPSVPYLLEYIQNTNLFPTVVYKFNDDLISTIGDLYSYLKSDKTKIPTSKDKLSFLKQDYYKDLSKKFDKNRIFLMENGICVISEADPDEYKRFVSNNMDKFQIIVSNQKLNSALHYIIYDLYFNKNNRITIPSNVDMYSLTQGAKIVTYTLGDPNLFHVIRSLVSPLYLNQNNLESTQSIPKNLPQSVTNRMFISYLKSCKEKHSETYPDYFKNLEDIKKLEDYFDSCNLDIKKYMKLSKENKRTKKILETIRHSIPNKLSFRSKLIKVFNKLFDLGGCQVMGLDGNKYRLIYLGDNALKFLNFPNYKSEYSFRLLIKPGEYYCILKSENDEKVLVTNYKFVKDILDIKKEDYSNWNYNVIYFNKGYVSCENDFGNLFYIKPLEVSYIQLNYNEKIINPNMSFVIPKETKEIIVDKLDKYMKNEKYLKEIIEEGSNNKKSDDKDFKGKDLESLVVDYYNLSIILRNTKLEHITKNHIIKNSLWGS